MAALVVTAASLTVAAETLPSAAGDEELLLETEINAQVSDRAALVLRSPDGRFWAPVGLLQSWRLRGPSGTPRVRDGRNYFPLDDIAGLAYRFDAARQRLVITAPPSAFDETVFSSERPPRPAPAVPSPGGFLNYAVSGARSGGSSGATDAGVQAEAGLFGRYGVLIGGVLARNHSEGDAVVRLDTLFTHDFPASLATLRIGDTTTSSGAWGRAVRIGGIQYGTNFGLQPGFIPFPTAGTGGQAALPSTVDVFVNNALVAQRSVPPGPFAITSIPMVTGSGTVQLVVTDLLGRETLITQPFYASTQLLAPGLSDYAVEAGLVRSNFGLTSADYGRAVAAGTWRHGFDDRFTGELRAEAQRDQVAVGASGNWLVGEIGVFSGTVAASTAREDGAGTLIGAGFDKETGRSGFSLRAQWSSADFRLSGVDASNPLPRQQVAASAGYQFGGWGTASAGYVAQWFRSTPTATALRDNRFGSLGYSLQVAASATVSLTALRDFGQGGTTTLWAMLTIPWGAVYSASLGQTHRSGAPASRADDTELTLQRNLPLGDGYGYRVFARTPGDVQASLAVQREVGTVVAEVSRQGGIWSGRLGASGGIGYLGGHVFASREITESFGIVSVGDYPGVGILVDNQPAGRTDGSGYAVLPRLRPYDINLIGIEQRDLPLDAQVDRLAIDAVPYYRSGVLADFPVRRSRGATFTVRLDDGGLLPSGATIQVNGGTEAFPVALGGQAYVTGLDRSNRVRARWRNQDCEFDLPFPPTPDPLPDLGTFACRGVKP